MRVVIDTNIFKGAVTAFGLMTHPMQIYPTLACLAMDLRRSLPLDNTPPASY
jgi:hypothetical protein